MSGFDRIAQHEQVTRRQHVGFRDVLDFARGAVRAEKLERSHLLTLFEQGLPTLRNHRLYIGRCKIIQTVADDLFPRQTQELAGPGAGIPIVTIIVSDQDGGGRLKYDGAEQQLKFFGAVLEQPG